MWNGELFGPGSREGEAFRFSLNLGPVVLYVYHVLTLSKEKIERFMEEKSYSKWVS